MANYTLPHPTPPGLCHAHTVLDKPSPPFLLSVSLSLTLSFYLSLLLWLARSLLYHSCVVMTGPPDGHVLYCSCILERALPFHFIPRSGPVQSGMAWCGEPEPGLAAIWSTVIECDRPIRLLIARGQQNIINKGNSPMAPKPKHPFTTCASSLPFTARHHHDDLYPEERTECREKKCIKFARCNSTVIIIWNSFYSRECPSLCGNGCLQESDSE